ncbi:MAG: glycosyltransferase family 2 protein [bacterium]
MNIFIIIPAYNEEKTIANAVDGVKKFGRVVVVDDGSKDLTKNLAKNAGAEVLSHIINRGQGAAIRTGIEYALINDADIVVHFDADGQHGANDIEKIITPILLNQSDIVLGSRFLKDNTPDSKTKIPLIRFLILKAAIVFTRIISGIKITDTHNGFRALSKNAAQKIKITQDGMAHASEILDEIVKNNLKYKEIPVEIKYTDYSKNKGQSSINSINIIKDLLFGKILK